jgi:hypothetical protein
VDNPGFDSNRRADFFLVSFAGAAVVFVVIFYALHRTFLSTCSEALRAHIARRKAMEFICRRCDRTTKHKLYRVTTEDAGVVLLNILVCSSCARLAKKLGLPMVKMEPMKTANKISSDSVMPDMKHQAVQP